VIHDPGQGASRQVIMFPAKPLVGAVVHALGPSPVAAFPRL
jgi:hypothetical protein